MSRRGTNSRNQRTQPMKVVHIKTHHVETDATSFKSVVQNLTGKDSTIAESPPRASSSSLSSSLAMRVKNEDNQNYGLGRSGSFKYLTRDLSFGRLLKEFPSVDELHKLLTFSD